MFNAICVRCKYGSHSLMIECKGVAANFVIYFLWIVAGLSRDQFVPQLLFYIFHVAKATCGCTVNNIFLTMFELCCMFFYTYQSSYLYLTLVPLLSLQHEYTEYLQRHFSERSD